MRRCRGFIPAAAAPPQPARPVRAGGRGLLLLVLLVVAVWLATGFYRVQPDEQGVVLRFGAFDRTSLPGLNYHIPWPVEAALTPSVTHINRVEVGFTPPPTADAAHDLPRAGGRPAVASTRASRPKA